MVKIVIVCIEKKSKILFFFLKLFFYETSKMVREVKEDKNIVLAGEDRRSYV